MPLSIRDSGAPAGRGLPRSVRPDEGLFAELSGAAGSAAGFYFDSLGTAVILVRDAEDDQLAMQAFRAIHGRGAFARGKHDFSGSVRTSRATFTFRQLAEWREIAFDHALSRIAGVRSVDLDEVHNRVNIGIASEGYAATRGIVEAALLPLGVPLNALSFHPESPTSSDRGAVPPSTLRGRTTDPFAGGLLVFQNTSGCTLGFTAVRDGVPGLVTASHCTVKPFEIDGAPIYQGEDSPVLIGSEMSDPFAYACALHSCRGSDAAWFRAENGAQMGIGTIVRPLRGSLSLNLARPYFYITSEDNNTLSVGQQVDKVGITTGWTSGPVTATCVDHQTEPFPTIIRCAYEARYGSNEGDSGGPVFRFTNSEFGDDDHVQLLGLHTGRWYSISDLTYYSRFSKLSRIKSDIGGTWTIALSPTLATPSTVSMTANEYTGRAHLSWSPVPGATGYDVFVFREAMICDVYMIDCKTPTMKYRIHTTATQLDDQYDEPFGVGPMHQTCSVAFSVVATGPNGAFSPSKDIGSGQVICDMNLWSTQ